MKMGLRIWLMDKWMRDPYGERNHGVYIVFYIAFHVPENPHGSISNLNSFCGTNK